MANYYASARTSYAKMKCGKKFRDWADTIPECKVITSASDKHGMLYGLIFTGDDCGSIPNSQWDEEADEHLDFDIYEEIQKHLADGWAISFKEAGAEKLRYILGFAAIVTKDTIEHTTLGKWIDETMNGLGDPLHTSPEY